MMLPPKMLSAFSSIRAIKPHTPVLTVNVKKQKTVSTPAATKQKLKKEKKRKSCPTYPSVYAVFLPRDLPNFAQHYHMGMHA